MPHQRSTTSELRTAQQCYTGRLSIPPSPDRYSEDHPHSAAETPAQEDGETAQQLPPEDPLVCSPIAPSAAFAALQSPDLPGLPNFFRPPELPRSPNSFHPLDLPGSPNLFRPPDFFRPSDFLGSPPFYPAPLSPGAYDPSRKYPLPAVKEMGCQRVGNGGNLGAQANDWTMSFSGNHSYGGIGDWPCTTRLLFPQADGWN